MQIIINKGPSMNSLENPEIIFSSWSIIKNCCKAKPSCFCRSNTQNNIKRTLCHTLSTTLDISKETSHTSYLLSNRFQVTWVIHKSWLMQKFLSLKSEESNAINSLLIKEGKQKTLSYICHETLDLFLLLFAFTFFTYINLLALPSSYNNY